MLHCKSCKKKFYYPNENEELEGKLIQCKYCDEQWLYESKTKYLENRLSELNEDLNNTETKINLRKKEFQVKINQLEEDLNNKKTELENQKLLQNKVAAFENRLMETEKLNTEELELYDKAGKIKKQIRITSENIFTYNKDIEEKTNYLENKINSYNKDQENDIGSFDKTKSKMIENEVVDININKDFNKINENKFENDTKKKKIKFFSPSFLK